MAEVERRYEGQELPLPDDWGGYRLRPQVYELWQHGEHRLHDRLRYTAARGRPSGAWSAWLRNIPPMAESHEPGGRGRARSRQRRAVERVRDTGFPIVMRGYDRQRVDRYVAEVADLVAELEDNQLSESVVQKALEEVGDQTSSILQRARETAGEIEAQSWAKAEATVERAEREAEITRRDADTYADRLADDTRALWEERQRLIEEMRQLADEVLGVADDALDRVQPPGSDLDDELEYDDDTTAAHPGSFGDDDTTAAEEGVFADEGRPGPEEPAAEAEEPAASEGEAATTPEADEAAEPNSGNGTADEASDLTTVFERPPAERRPD